MKPTHRPVRGIAGPILLLLSVLITTSPVLHSQTVTVRSVVAQVSTLSFGDIDFIHSSSPKWLFTLNLDVSPPSTVNAVMTITLDVSLANGEHYPRATELVTKPFVINTSRSVTNLDIGRGKPIEDDRFTMDETARRRIQDIALSSGSVPAGRYDFHVEVTVAGSAPATDNFSIIITNPSSVELLAPADRDLFVNEFPLFQWRGDAPKWSVAVYELLAGQTSLEEAITGVPHLPPTVTTMTSYQYPTGGVRPLQPGHTYVWFVQGLVPATGGTELLYKSELRSFTVASARLSSSDLLDQLEQALGPKYRGLFDQIRAEGLTPTSSIRLNGSPISTTDLFRLLNQLRNNPDAASVSLE